MHGQAGNFDATAASPLVLIALCGISDANMFRCSGAEVLGRLLKEQNQRKRPMTIQCRHSWHSNQQTCHPHRLSTGGVGTVRRRVPNLARTERKLETPCCNFTVDGVNTLAAFGGVPSYVSSPHSFPDVPLTATDRSSQASPYVPLLSSSFTSCQRARVRRLPTAPTTPYPNPGIPAPSCTGYI